jgi:hypothetical protein
MRRSLLLVVLVAVGCTKSNPAAHCQNGTCTDPNFPFCDVNGVVGGEPGACIAATCTAGQFTECRDNAEVRCNATGDNYEVVQCERGCDAAADGCRLCNPNETACTNGKVATCDSSGAVVSQYSCPLGCFEAEPRCREIAPSNGLATYADMLASAPDVELTDALITTVNGQIQDVNGAVTLPSILLPATAQGPAVRVFFTGKLRVQRAHVQGAADGYSWGPAVAFFARGDVLVTGELKAEPTVGGFFTNGCGGANGTYSLSCTVNAVSGAGGGANATNGGRGGYGASLGGEGGIATGTASLVPLRGGCGGGATDGPEGVDGSVGQGGGAIQIASREAIVVEGNIDVRGGNGQVDYYRQRDGFYVTGGGAGGGLLLEAPMITLKENSQLIARGGDGGALCDTTSGVCGAGGLGASATASAQPGGDATCDGAHFTSGGAGGGGLGRVRINTISGSYDKSSTALEDASVSTGTVSTR